MISATTNSLLVDLSFGHKTGAVICQTDTYKKWNGSFSYKHFIPSDFQGQIKVLVLFFWNTTIKNKHNHTQIFTKKPKKTLCTIFFSLRNIVRCGTESIKPWCCMRKKSRVACFFVFVFLRCWGLSLRENESACLNHNSSCLASRSLSSSTFSLSSSGVITPSLFRSWLLNMSEITCSMTCPGFMRPLPSATCSLMNSPN